MVYVYAAVAWITYVLQHAFTDLPWARDWPAFVEHFTHPGVHHEVLRLFTVGTGCLLVPAVYRLARTRFSRGVALLAAAAIAVDPVHLLSSMQVRPHVPAVTLIALAAVPLLRLAGRGGAGATPAQPPAAGTRPSALALRAGIGFGLASAVFQVGLLACAWAAALIALRVRPVGHRVRALVALGLGFGLTLGALTFAAGRSDVARPLPGSHVLDDTATLSLPARMLSWGMAERFPQAARAWLEAGPMLAVGLLAFVVACALRRRHPADLLSFLSFPLLELLFMGLLLGAHVRYLLAAAPFLAVLAAAGALAPRRAALRATLAGLLVLVPLVASLRTLALLSTSDTRVVLAGLLERAALGTDGSAPRLAVALRSSVPALKLTPNTPTFLRPVR
jgi:hypothetical protein